MKRSTLDICELFFGATGLPVSCFDSEENLAAWYPLWSRKMGADLMKLSFDGTRNPDAITTASQGIYGRICLPDGSWVVVGPAYGETVNDEITRCYIQEIDIPAGKWDLAYATLAQSERMNFQKFTRYLALLHCCLTGEKIAILEHFQVQEPEARLPEKVPERSAHNTYEYEQRLYAQVREGDGEKLLDFMVQYHSSNFNRGRLAEDPLRNAKNRFIVAAVKLQVLAAIPGKLDLETSYQMTDDYIWKAENANSIGEIEGLEYKMIMDFCCRIGKSHAPTGISPEIHSCMRYIQEHVHGRLSVNDVAEFLGKSQSYLHTHFKEETGFSVRDYVMVCKLEEAARLLKISDRSLADISGYLCFSSQSYFQNVFKKEYGVTPMQYRKEYRI